MPANMSYEERKKVVDNGGDFERCEAEQKAKLDVNDKYFVKSVAKDSGSDIISPVTAKEVVDVHQIGKINRDIYKCITEDIRTDEVIITDERILHVKERHPNDYERFCSYIPGIIQDPDYIVEVNKANTAILLKEVTEAEEKFKLVLRISVKNDPDGYKNSVISFWHIGDTTWRKTLKNKNILYKKE